MMAILFSYGDLAGISFGYHVTIREISGPACSEPKICRPHRANAYIAENLVVIGDAEFGHAVCVRIEALALFRQRVL